MIRDFPWLGSGLGTYRWVFPEYRSGDIPSYGVWEQAHNSTLEAAAEMGIPFALLLGIGWLASLVVLFRGMSGRNRDAILPTAAFWIGLLVILHSQVDFPLQVPGFALAVCPILGMGMAQSFSSRAKALTYPSNKS
jgi:O-antigen ligase